MPTNHDETLQERYQREVGGKVICPYCLGSGVMPKIAIAPEPPDIKCQKCNGTGMTEKQP